MNHHIFFRRPVAQRAEDIGAWYNILVALTTLSVLINAFILAFTSQLIPSLVYRYHSSPDNTMNGYVDWTLSYFKVKDFSNESRPLDTTVGGIPQQDECRYPGFRESYYPYNRNMKYWIILSVRLAFVLCFVVFVFFVSWLINWIIKDVPTSLQLAIRREKFLASQADKNHRVKVEKRRVAVPMGSLTVVAALRNDTEEADCNGIDVVDPLVCVKENNSNET